jgi:hypothetical protein
MTIFFFLPIYLPWSCDVTHVKSYPCANDGKINSDVDQLKFGQEPKVEGVSDPIKVIPI